MEKKTLRRFRVVVGCRLIVGSTDSRRDEQRNRRDQGRQECSLE